MHNQADLFGTGRARRRLRSRGRGITALPLPTHPLNHEASEEAMSDTDRPWGFMQDGAFIPIPKGPMVRDGYGPPPLDITLPHSGEVRHIIERPEAPLDGA